MPMPETAVGSSASARFVPSWAWRFLGVASLGLATLPFVAGSPVWDDSDFVALFNARGYGALFETLFGYYFRPLGLLAMWGPWALGASHWVNASLSALIMIGIAWLGASSAARLTRPDAPLVTEGAAFAILCVFFSLNAAMAEPEVWWSGRFDALLALGACLHMRLSLWRAPWRPAALALATAGACLCKESALFLAPFWAGFCACCALWEGGLGARLRAASAAGATLAAAATCGIWRAIAMDGGAPLRLRPSSDSWESISWSLQAAGRHMAMWFGAPWESYPLLGHLPKQGWGWPALGVAGCVGALALIRMGWRGRSLPSLALGLGLAQSIPLGVVSGHILLSVDSFVVARNVAPSIAWGAPALLALFLWARPRVPAWSWRVGVCAFAACLGVQALPARHAWTSNEQLWLSSPDALAMNPESVASTANLGYALIGAGKPEHALALSMAYISKNPQVDLLACQPRAVAAIALDAMGKSTESATRGYESFAYCNPYLAVFTVKDLLLEKRCEEARRVMNSTTAGRPGSMIPFHGFWSMAPSTKSAWVLDNLKVLRKAQAEICGSPKSETGLSKKEN